MKALPLDYQGMMIHASRDAWFNATEIAALFGKQVYEWLRLPETERYIAALCERETRKRENADAVNTGKSRFYEVGKSHFVISRRGKNGGTWLHPKLAIRFAQWLDVGFAVWCDEQIEALLTSQPVWEQHRHDLRTLTKLKNRFIAHNLAAAGKDVKPYHFINEALLENAALTGEYKAIDRDALPTEQLAQLEAIQAENTFLIANHVPREQRKARLQTLRLEVRS